MDRPPSEHLVDVVHDAASARSTESHGLHLVEPGVVGVAGLEEALLARPDLFVGTLAEKLLTFALGRGVEYYDAPAIRKIVRETKANDYRFSTLVLGIVQSVPFQMRNPT